MNAFNNVNLAGACILTSTDYARELGIPEDRWIYPLGGAGTSDSANCKYDCQIHLPSLMCCSLGATELLFKSSNLKIT
jgi:hypothetical protein